ncbi:MAG: adenosylmethionine--8-amino-7-oxononanoate transaminase [Bdellovibrionota bacterium]
MAEQDLRKDLKSIDLEHLWHPFTQARTWIAENDPLIVERAEGCELIDIAGRRYLDGVSSLWCNVHGHGAPELIAALKDQAETLCHSTLLGLSHRPVLELTDRLVKIIPAGLNRLFYADSGSTAVEAGIRMCVEFWQKQDGSAAKKKQRLLSLETAYHGDTLGAVGVGYVEAFHSSLRANVVPAIRIPPPHIFRFFQGESDEAAESLSLDSLKSTLSSSAKEIAALIIEPLVQGAAGIWTYSPAYLSAVAELCARHDVLLIIDEVATGFGKTGTMFACEQADVSPDVLIMGKGLSGGYLPISAAAASEEIFQGFVGEPEELKTFFYGQTFAGNPLAARVAAANLDLFEQSSLLEELGPRIDFFQRLIAERISGLPHVDEVRCQGVMTGIELTSVPGSRVPYPMQALAGARITRKARELGAVIRPLGNVMVLMPPLAMKEPELERLVDITAESIRTTLG